jgi:hypothetical protein
MLALAGVAAVSLASVPAFAHHSFAMFDNTKDGQPLGDRAASGVGGRG